MDNQPKPSGSRFPLGPKLIFVVLGAILLIEVIFAVKILAKPLPPPPPKIAPLTGAKIVLVSPKTTYNKGETVPVTVRLTTGGRNTSGVDVILRFDPKILEASASGIKRGNIYQEYPVASLDPQGVVSVSGISVNKDFSGVGVFANVIFTAKASGQTSVKVDFQKDSTTDSNVVETGTTKDILDQVFNLDLTIK